MKKEFLSIVDKKLKSELANQKEKLGEEVFQRELKFLMLLVICLVVTGILVSVSSYYWGFYSRHAKMQR